MRAKSLSGFTQRHVKNVGREISRERRGFANATLIRRTEIPCGGQQKPAKKKAECADSPERILNASTVLQPDRSDCLFLTLVLLWVGSKQISLTELKACSSRIISDKVYTAKDFVKAEIELLGTINFEIDTGRSCPSVLEDLLRELRRVSRVGDFIKLNLREITIVIFQGLCDNQWFCINKNSHNKHQSFVQSWGLERSDAHMRTYSLRHLMRRGTLRHQAALETG
ncbi:unnamed protein product [Closterium sp. Naga37s-1]|nr:unnamed protein product [Closterium sp. Naga37s-1]